jgi:hypothetical protein
MSCPVGLYAKYPLGCSPYGSDVRPVESRRQKRSTRQTPTIGDSRGRVGATGAGWHAVATHAPSAATYAPNRAMRPPAYTRRSSQRPSRLRVVRARNKRLIHDDDGRHEQNAWHSSASALISRPAHVANASSRVEPSQWTAACIRSDPKRPPALSAKRPCSSSIDRPRTRPEVL